MKPTKLGTALFCMALLATWSAPRAGERAGVGLALAGGGARGFAHIGVLKVLEEVGMPIGAISGTSIGAIIGGLYAAGYHAAEIDSIAQATDWLAKITRDVDRRHLGMEHKRLDTRYLVTMGLDGYHVRLPSGLRSGQEIMKLLARLTLHVHDVRDFRELPIPFSCVAMDMVTGEAVVFDHGYLPDAMRASMSIQSVFTPMRIDGRVLADGGPVRNLPAEDARNLGAEVVIGVDVGDSPRSEAELDSWFAIASQLILLDVQRSREAQRRLCDVLIVPDLERFSMMDFGKTDELVEFGERAARAIEPRLRALADSLNSVGKPDPLPERPTIDEVTIGAVVFDGLSKTSRAVAEAEVAIKPPAVAAVDDIEEGVDNLYSTQYFDHVTYRLGQSEPNATLHIRVTEQRRDLFRVGLRFDSTTRTALLLNATFRNRTAYASTVSVDGVIAQDPAVEIRYLLHVGLLRALGLRARAKYAEETTDIYENRTFVAEYETSVSQLELVLGTIFGTRFTVGVGLRGEYTASKPNIGDQGLPLRFEWAVPVLGRVILDTADQSAYPTQGLLLDLSATWSPRQLGSDQTFGRYYLDQRIVLPVFGRFSLLQSLYVGTTRGGDPPLVYNFSLGRVNFPATWEGQPGSFLGFKRGELRGRDAQALQFGLQYEVTANVVALLRWNLGNAFDDSNIKLESGRYLNGGGVTIGYRLPRGRLEYSAMFSEYHSFLSHVTVGSDF